MKYLLFLLFPCFLFAQDSNPDGEIGYLSLHLTPLINMGSTDYLGSAGYKMASDETKPRFSFEALVKIPLSTAFTMSAFYRLNNFTITSQSAVFLAPEAKCQQTTIGMTLSFYTGSTSSRHNDQMEYRSYVKR